MTTWYPDTCGCVFDYADDAAPGDTPTLAGMVACCAAHSALPPPVAFNTVIEENRRKNGALTIAQGVLPGITPDSYEWEFDAQRRLRVGFRGLPPGLRAAVQAALDTKLGPGRATVT